MPESSFLPYAVFVAMILGSFCFFKSIASLATALHLLVLMLIFGGIVAVNLGGGGFAVAFRDAFIIVPIYLCVFTTNAGRQAMAWVPVDLLLSIVFFLLVILVCLLKPVSAPLLQVVIGLKVWLFYLPFLAVGIVVARQPDLMIRLFRQILLWGGVACAVGLLQSFLVRMIGYEPAMHLFFGEYANRVTQEFAYFDVAGGIYRIPATFSFSAQYGAFLFLYLTIAVIEVNCDPDERIQRIARIAVFVALVAGLLSGSRSMVLVLPAMFVVYALCGVLSSRLLSFAPAGLTVGVGVLTFAALDPIGYFIFGRALAANYTDSFIFQQISESLSLGLGGAGIGASTVGARYVLGGTAIDDGSLIGFESYFAKAAVELGWLGFASVIIIFVVIVWRAAVMVPANFRHFENAIIAPAAVYLVLNVILSFKGSMLDSDPGNIFFWLLLGIMIGIDRARRAAVAGEHGLVPGEEADGYDGSSTPISG